MIHHSHVQPSTAHSLRRSRALQGFTFVEMLVSLLILGLISGILIIRILPDTESKLRDETQRLGDVLTLAGDFSRLSGQSLAWVWRESKDKVDYAFEVQNRDGRWVPFAATSSMAESLGAHRLPAFITLTALDLSGDKVPLGDAAKPEARIIFRPSGINPIFTLTLGVRAQTELAKSLQSDPLGRVFDPNTLPK